MTPRPLRAGDRVTVVSPAGPVPAGLLHAGVAWLTTWGLDVRVAPHALDVHPDLPHLAGTDADRAADLSDAWHDPDVAAVLCARGGYGSRRIVDRIDWAAAARTPKVFLGSSDITVLHEPLWRAGVPTWFGPMPATAAFVHDPTARDLLRRALFGEPAVLRGTTVVGGRARGIAVGGTVSLLGAPPPDGAIAWLEDVGEEPYRLDRLLTDLLRGGWFDQVAGIVLGSWTGCRPVEAVDAVLWDRLGGLGVPVLGSVRFGHCAGQHTVPLGVPMDLDADAGVVTPVSDSGE
ncbi:LD-carboxypeptidase [Actinosynnema sp. NPDC047251]|uniref:Putative carboxypeptidase n=1 Tax=Saccharothrix espanaensis (strain ATCC 51144 / DSM 44229 / JCM 9112 / NBRC 15066 / NRRL 15764) TaxID=1179773 RepID=K0JUL5_SACES|nr:LD-carboxypeptidase [Saccharothrix espanaensis]CCH31545.1 putative carboxypeptidase [Saccharothrix espanaensis DSM 44229]